MISNNYKVRFNYYRINTKVEEKVDGQPVTACTPIESILLVLNSHKVSLGQVLNVEVVRL